MPSNKELVTILQSRLESVAKIKTKDWWEKYLKYTIEFRGVNLAVIRDELKVWYTEQGIDNLSLDDQLDLALSFFEEEYAEDKLAGVLFLQLYLYDRFEWKLLFPRFEGLFENNYIFDWNVNDWFCVRVLGPIIEKNGMECAKAISGWHSSGNVWQARCSLVAFANLTGNEEFRTMLLESCSILIQREERFAKKAVGWIMRELAKSDEKVVVGFIQENGSFFSRESLENAIKYFDKEEKKYLRKFRSS
ncbi:3-methyladenine DNA glycosylase AlkD [Methanohalophilus levihalophilus]|uniref:DNA alkylation repair protein n=1 Tax=Methanohalophilus levihalophilus TaxID=1431282 RepID=UPI001AE79C9E|nr:DNA alkylation repair protein [Methanohalophilus levihalophilus]MBP2029102.1 3-methyladenine DNA glycosylase AlkD [Methanohalophilus levihalophilus]